MNVGSLFSGIGGLDLGLARAGFRHSFFCESDAYRRDVLRARWPGVPVWDDVRDDARDGDACADERGPRRFGGRDGTGPTVDLLCGGFPCQDLSVAGQRRGLMHEGGRSNLFFEFARIIDTVRPRWVLLENVPGLLSSNGGRDFGVVLGTLADIGYGLGWRVLDSRFFGVPQRRRRVFIVGTVAHDDPRSAAERAGEILAVGSRCQGHPATRGETGPDVAGTPGGGAGERGWAQDVERMTFIPTAYSLRRDPGGTGQGHNTNYVTSFHNTPDPISDPDVSLLLGRKTFGVGVAVSENQRGELLETDYAHQLTSGGGKPGQGYPAVREGASVRRLMPVECERLQALPDGWTDLGGTPDSKRYAALGDAVTATVAEWIGRRLIAA